MELNINIATYKAPDFEIHSNDIISQAFLDKGILTFKQAATYIQDLPYGRNANKLDLTTLFIDHCGTCSTKHAILKQLADENNFTDIILICGIFRMNGQNTPEVASTLSKHGLDFIPEAHNYLKYHNQILDYTKPDANAINFVDDLMEEVEMLPNQIADYKVKYHKKYLANWLENNPEIKLSLDEIWTIREQCIKDLEVG